ncbi:MAG TPA: sigma-70 family RNA polymerase sigma factor [Xanthobacteraceae bacterium]|nr:sigma-70 family RNA polymerase sigma factor [Xanthobacteraceae bacterium]
MKAPTSGHLEVDELATLIAACAAGRRDSLRALYERESGPMIGAAMRIVRRRELAEEVVHDVFVQIWRHAGSFDPALGRGRAWMFTILRNRAISILRNASRELPTEDEALTLAVERNAVTDDAYDRLGDGSALKRCLEGLEPKRRAGVLLAYVEGLSHGEIAARLNVPLGTAKAWIRRSLIQLRECLA